MRSYTESFEYDAVGNILQMFHDTGDSHTWTRNYTYDAASNKVATTEMPADPSGGPYSGTYTHDARGNMSSMPSLSSIGWDWADRMQTANLGGGGSVYFTYDSGGNRVRKVWDKTSALRDERIYLGNYELWRESSVSGGTPTVQEERQTVHVFDDVRRVAMIETKTVAGGSTIGPPTPRMRFQIANQLASAVVELTETGAIISYEEYFAFGMTSFHSANGSIDVSARRYRYNGKERDEETGLYYYGARYYAAWLGRWTAVDPSGNAAGSRYTYVGNHPIHATDPTGRDEFKSSSSVNDRTNPLVYSTWQEFKESNPGPRTDADYRTLWNDAHGISSGAVSSSSGPGGGNTSQANLPPPILPITPPPKSPTFRLPPTDDVSGPAKYAPAEEATVEAAPEAIAEAGGVSALGVASFVGLFVLLPLALAIETPPPPPPARKVTADYAATHSLPPGVEVDEPLYTPGLPSDQIPATTPGTDTTPVSTPSSSNSTTPVLVPTRQEGNYSLPGVSNQSLRLADPGLDAFVDRLRKAGVNVTSTNIAFYGPDKRILGEIDIVTPKGIIQYKSGVSSAHDVIEQVKMRTEPFVGGTTIYAFIDNTTRAGNRTVAGARTHGVNAYNDFDQLVTRLR